MKKQKFDLSPDEVRFQSLLLRMEGSNVSFATAMKIVGGKARLMRLMKEGTIRAEKPEGAPNRQWRVDAADCFRCVKPNRAILKMA